MADPGPVTGRWHRPLCWFAAAMVGLAVVSAVGYFVDDRILVGVPIWAKPLKFSVSFALYSISLAWMVSRFARPRRRRIAWWTGTVLVGASSLEMVAIVGQVIRGEQSHFNDSTPFNHAVFLSMGGLVSVIFTATIAIAVMLTRDSPTADRAATWAVRLGLALSVAGMSVGFLILRPTDAQLAQGADAPIRGAHSVGVIDGGPSLPLLGWSTTGGDLRIPHFVGMHALQILPLLAIALTLIPAARRLHERIRVRIVLLAAFAYTGLLALTLWQALRGQPVTAPDSLTIAGFTGLVVLVAVAGLGIVRTRHGTALIAARHPR